MDYKDRLTIQAETHDDDENSVIEGFKKLGYHVDNGIMRKVYRIGDKDIEVTCTPMEQYEIEKSMTPQTVEEYEDYLKEQAEELIRMAYHGE